MALKETNPPITKTKTHKQTNHKKSEKNHQTFAVSEEKCLVSVCSFLQNSIFTLNSGSSAGDFCSSTWDTSCQSAHKYFRAAFLCKVPSLNPHGGLSLLGTEPLFLSELTRGMKIFATKLIPELQNSVSGKLLGFSAW